jgi:acetyltransferase
VQLNLNPEDVEGASRAMLANVSQKAPNARITGFTVEEQIQTSDAHELILGASVDPTFGPVLLFGQGGIAVEIVADRAMGLPPLNSVLAKDMILRTRVSRLLRGYRNIPPANEAAIVDALIALSDIVIAHPHIVEIDINPLLAGSQGVRALDARISLRKDGNRQAPAIRPYPVELEREIRTRQGERLFMRPIRPEDEAAIIRMVEESSPEDRQLRFLGALTTLNHELAARLTQIDYDREMALVALKSEHENEVLAVARMVSDPNFSSAEFALMVKTSLKGRGLGYMLMQQLLNYAGSRGIGRVYGDVANGNEQMLDLARSLGASISSIAADLMRATFTLPAASAPMQTSA